MTTDPTTDADEAPPALQRALVQSHEVKDKVERHDRGYVRHGSIARPLAS